MTESKALLLPPSKNWKQLSLESALLIFYSSQRPQNEPRLLKYPDRGPFAQQAKRGGCHGTIDNAVDQ